MLFHSYINLISSVCGYIFQLFQIYLGASVWIYYKNNAAMA